MGLFRTLTTVNKLGHTDDFVPCFVLTFRERGHLEGNITFFRSLFVLFSYHTMYAVLSTTPPFVSTFPIFLKVRLLGHFGNDSSTINSFLCSSLPCTSICKSLFSNGRLFCFSFLWVDPPSVPIRSSDFIDLILVSLPVIGLYLSLSITL